MTVEYRTIRDAAEAWVREMNAIPQGMIEKLMGMNPDDWTEITKPAAGDTVYVYDAYVFKKCSLYCSGRAAPLAWRRQSRKEAHQ